LFIGDNEDEEEGGSGYDEDGLEFFESDEGLFRIPGLDRNTEDILMIQYSDTDPSGSGPLVPWNTNTVPLPFGIFEDPINGNENTGSVIGYILLLYGCHVGVIIPLTDTTLSH
jgi:hypothetical protein